MTIDQLVKAALSSNDEVRLVLEVATRAREMEAREISREIGVSTDVVVVPIHPQCAV
jgi:hypothetical protein